MADSFCDISVLICTKDRPEVLRPCIESILSGRYAPMEIVVIDQSTNGSTEKAIHDISTNSAVSIRHRKLDSVGHTKARNVGIKECRGEVIAFTDDDCIADPDWLATIAREFEDPSVNCVCGATLPAGHKDRPRQTLLSTLHYRKRRVVSGLVNPVTLGRGNNMALRRDDLVTLGGFNERIGVGTNVYAGDDLDLFYRLISADCTVVQSPDAIVFHRQPDDWPRILCKKRGYAIAVAAVLGCRARQGDPIAVALMTGKILYEFICLLCGGLIRLNPRIASVGWHSLMGSLSGLKHTSDRELNEAITLFSFLCSDFADDEEPSIPLDIQPCESPQGTEAAPSPQYVPRPR